jgi:hypothetical protein
MALVPTRQILGTAQTCINTTTNITAGNFSAAPAATYDNTTDAAVPRAQYAQCVLRTGTWSVAPAVGTVIELWGVPQDVDGSDDDTDAPSGTAEGGARMFGVFRMAAVTTAQRRTIIINMLGYEHMNFFLKNGTAQTMTNNGGTACTLKVKPVAVGVDV